VLPGGAPNNPMGVAALTLSGAPFLGPIGAARVGFVDGAYVLNPAIDDMEKLRENPEQRLDLIVAGTKDAVMMVESEAYELSEAEMLGEIGIHLDLVLKRNRHYEHRVCRINGNRNWHRLGSYSASYFGNLLDRQSN